MEYNKYEYYKFITPRGTVWYRKISNKVEKINYVYNKMKNNFLESDTYRKI